MPRYVALIEGKRGAYGVYFPDCPGAVAQEKTLDEALVSAGEVLALWVAEERAHGRRSVPRSFEAVVADPEVQAAIAEGAVPVMVPLVIDTSRSVKANISLDAGLLAAIDEAAATRGLTRSAFLATAARDKIASGG